MKEGYLQKKGQRLKGWKRRWFVCDARTVAYYINRKDRKPNAVIPLDSCTVQDGGLSETWNSPRIYLTDGATGVMYCLSAEDSDTVTEWLAVFRYAVARANGMDEAPVALSEPPVANNSRVNHPVARNDRTRSDRSGGGGGGTSTVPTNSHSRGTSDDDEAKLSGAVSGRGRSTSAAGHKTGSVAVQKTGGSGATEPPLKRVTRLTSGTTGAATTATPIATPAVTTTVPHGHVKNQGKVQHLPTTISLENELSNGLDTLEALLYSGASGSHRTRKSTVVFRPLGAVNGVLQSLGTDTVSGAVYARASVVLPVSSEVAAYLLSDHTRRSEWDVHFPRSSHVASFDDATDLVHLAGGFPQLRATRPFLSPQLAAAASAAVAASAALASVASWDALVLHTVCASVAGSVVNSVDYSALCTPRDLVLLRHIRETSVLDSHRASTHAHLLNAEGDECGQSMVLILEKSVVSELKPATRNVVRAHVGLSGWLLEPVDGSRTLATYVTDLDMKGWLSPATKRAFLLERLACVAVLSEYVAQTQLCGGDRALGFDGDESDDEHATGPDESAFSAVGTSSSGGSNSSGSGSRRRGDGAGPTSSEFHPSVYMQSMVRTPTGGLKLTDKEVAKKQGGVLKEVIKSAGAKILEGKSAVSLSLPVRIFEPRTNLERVTDMFLYAPTFLTVAAAQTDPVERLKYVVAFMVAGLHHAVGQLKPFNPILGETYQATMNDGAEVFCEHTSHHPPISNFQVVGREFTVAGHILWHGSFSMKSNALFQIQKGPIRVRFADGATIVYSMPQIQLGGFMWGDRTFDIVGPVVFEDATNHLLCEVKFNPDEKKGMGGMFSSAKTPSDSFRGAITSTAGGGSEICELSGSWLDELKFADRAYWTMNREPSGYLVPFPAAKLLESDSRNREDLRHLVAGDLDAAQDWKVKLEVLQRADRKARLDGRRANHWSFKEDKQGGHH